MLSQARPFLALHCSNLLLISALPLTPAHFKRLSTAAYAKRKLRRTLQVDTTELKLKAMP